MGISESALLRTDGGSADSALDARMTLARRQDSPRLGAPRCLFTGRGQSWARFAQRIVVPAGRTHCDPSRALHLFGESLFEAVIFDWVSVRSTVYGDALCRAARSAVPPVKVVAVTSRAACADRIEAWEAGVDDCIDDEIDIDEFVARMRALCRRHVAPDSDTSGVAARADQLAIVYRLSPREREVLALLVQGVHQKEIAGRFGCGYATVRTHARRLCHKLSCSGTREVILKFFLAS